MEFADFQAQVEALVPFLHITGPDQPLDSASADALGRSMVRTAVAKVGGGLPVELVATIDTFGEAHEWCAARAPAPTAGWSSVELRPIDGADVPELYRAALEPASAHRWRHRGATPSLRRFSEQLHEGTLAQFVVWDRAGGQRCGLVSAYNARFDNQTAYIAFCRTSEGPRHGQMFEGMFVFVEYLLRTWNFRKLYAEVPAYNEAVISAAGGGLLREEGRLTEHDYHDGRWWDLVIFALTRADWERFAHRWRPHLQPPAPAPALRAGSPR
jgi:RimJ/RimL family protein N-acetyltransferase